MMDWCKIFARVGRFPSKRGNLSKHKESYSIKTRAVRGVPPKGAEVFNRPGKICLL
jgi:hypothetical protein